MRCNLEVPRGWVRAVERLYIELADMPGDDGMSVTINRARLEHQKL